LHLPEMKSDHSVYDMSKLTFSTHWDNKVNIIWLTCPRSDQEIRRTSW
jgi:hypothetical protein